MFYCAFLDKKWSVYLKIDVGYHRAGVPSSDETQILSIAKALLANCKSIEFQGLYAHCGNSYQGNFYTFYLEKQTAKAPKIKGVLFEIEARNYFIYQTILQVMLNKNKMK